MINLELDPGLMVLVETMSNYGYDWPTNIIIEKYENWLEICDVKVHNAILQVDK